MHKLKDYPLYYESTPTDDLLKKLRGRTQSAKLKAVRTGWVAQVRPTVDGERVELSEIATSPQEALRLLDKRMIEMGLYD